MKKRVFEKSKVSAGFNFMNKHLISTPISIICVETICNAAD